MSNLREAAQQALEAMEYMHQEKCDYMRRNNLGDPLREDAARLALPAITALRAALAEPVQEPVGNEWEPCVKLPVTVHVRAQRTGETHVSTREGITPVKPDDLIMRGVSGEEYPIGHDIFERTYQRGEAPPQRKPLTDSIIGQLIHDHCELPTYAGMFAFARAIERANGIGGEG